jgi:hypothetical protein
MRNDQLSAADLGWIERSQSYLWQFAPWLVIWIIAAVWIVWRRKFPEATGFFLMSVPIGAYNYLISPGLFFGGPVPGPGSQSWLMWVNAVSVGWGAMFALSILGSIGYGIASIVGMIRNRRGN